MKTTRFLITFAPLILAACSSSSTEPTFDYEVTTDGFLLFGTFLGSRMVEHFVRAS
jgi:hypothetical protein